MRRFGSKYPLAEDSSCVGRRVVDVGEVHGAFQLVCAVVGEECNTSCWLVFGLAIPVTRRHTRNIPPSVGNLPATSLVVAMSSPAFSPFIQRATRDPASLKSAGVLFVHEQARLPRQRKCISFRRKARNAEGRIRAVTRLRSSWDVLRRSARRNACPDSSYQASPSRHWWP